MCVYTRGGQITAHGPLTFMQSAWPCNQMAHRNIINITCIWLKQWQKQAIVVVINDIHFVIRLTLSGNELYYKFVNFQYVAH